MATGHCHYFQSIRIVNYLIFGEIIDSRSSFHNKQIPHTHHFTLHIVLAGMGICASQEENENEIQTSFDPKNIYYDHTGNLRFGIVLNDIVEEMRRMIVNDSLQEGATTWYIIDSSWLSAWLYFAHYDKYTSPCPGPCRNDDLITYHHPSQLWIPRKNLVLATKDHPGHYCKINEETWNLFQECYEYSGPAIRFNSTDRVNSLHS
jgi:hypothetical protein